MARTDEAFAAAQRHIWTIGDYPAVARRMFPVAAATVEAAGIGPGQRVLDVGTGDGNASIEAAQRGATVVGIDLTPAQLDKAASRCETEGVEVELRLGDAQDLDVDDDAFDVVVSVLGMIFAPDHAAALGEMARACAPGGTVAAASWAAGGWMGQWRASVAEALLGDDAPPPVTGSGPDAWGDPDEVRRRFAAVGLEVDIEHHVLEWSFGSVDEALGFFVTASGPFVAFMDAMRERGLEGRARELMRATLAGADTTPDPGCHLESPYLVMVARTPSRPTSR